MPRRRSRRDGIGAVRVWLLHYAHIGRSGVRLMTVGLVALSLWMLSSFVGQVIDSAGLERRKQEYQAEIAQLEAENLSLKEHVAYAESPLYAERIAREQLGYAREGDSVLLPSFPERTPVPPTPTIVPLPHPPRQPNWRAWVAALFPTP